MLPERGRIGGGGAFAPSQVETVSPQPNRRQSKAPNTITPLRTRRHPGTTDTRDVPRYRGDTDERRKKNHHFGVGICTTI